MGCILDSTHLVLSSQITTPMQRPYNSSKASSDYLILDVTTQQANILQKIEALTQAAGPQVDALRWLRHEYNDLVDQVGRLAPSPFSDPIKKLPTELWPDIIEPLLDVEYPVDILLNLTSVSQRWCNTIVSAPRLWVDIVFDDKKHDYLAKAVMGLSLSGSCELNVCLRLSLASLKEAISFLLPETKRTRSLFIDRPLPCPAAEIIEQIQEMPILKNLHIPGGSMNPLEDEAEKLGLNRMPSLQVLKGPSIPIRSKLWGHLITDLDVDAPELMRKGTIERCQTLPNLRRMFISQPETQGPEVAPYTPTPQLYSVTYVEYDGLGFGRIAKWFGTGLVDLRIGAESFASLDELANSLGYFPCLTYFVLSRITSWFPHDTHKQPKAPFPIKSIFLFFIAPGSPLQVEDISTETKNLEFLCEALVGMVPSFEALDVSHGRLTSTCCMRISSLTSLLDLRLHNCELVDHVPLSAKFLRSLSCTSDSSLLLAYIVAPALRSLRIYAPDKFSTPNTEQNEIPRFFLSGPTVSNIVSLTLSVDRPIRWEFVSSSSLIELGLTVRKDEALSVVPSDVLEGILMRPSDLPMLKSIKLTGRFFEWDVLLLMLERRIVASHLGVSHINNLTISHDLPYKLLHPITTLLKGKLPEREPNDQFSLASIQTRIFNEELTGCYACGLSFRHCDRLLGRRAWPSGLRIHLWLGEKYEIPSEYLIAEPPLSPDTAEWLSGKLTRRCRFVEGYKEFLKRSDRLISCEVHRYYFPSVIITGHSLDGVHFEQDCDSG